MTREIKLIDGTVKTISLDSPELQNHFEDPYNYTKEILNQFNNEDYYQQFITKDDKIILDLGGNVGLFSLHVSPYAEKIVIVEPTPTHMQKQKQILKDVAGVYHEEAALSHYTGTTDFYWCGINTTMNSLQNRFDRSFKVDCITLEDIFRKYHLEQVDFCKIDIEGSENTAVTTQLLKPVADKIKKILIETHPPDAETQEKFAKIFEECGFTVEKFNHDGVYGYRK